MFSLYILEKYISREVFGTSTHVNHSANRGSVLKKHHFKAENLKKPYKIFSMKKNNLFFLLILNYLNENV